MALRLLYMALMSLGLLLGRTPVRLVPATLGGPSGVALTAEEARFVALVNTERTARGLVPLTVAPLLVKVAREKSTELYTLHYWGHESPVVEKRTAMRRVLYYLPPPAQNDDRRREPVQL